MAILAWIVFGLIAGIVAKAISPGKENLSWFWTSILGIAGAVVGGFLGGLIGVTDGTAEFSLNGFLLAVGGSLLVLFIYERFVAKKR